jgi:hypothetical protein
VFAAVDWASLHVAGAFILGAVFATVATIRVMRAVAGLLASELRRQRRDSGDDRGPDVR